MASIDVRKMSKDFARIAVKIVARAFYSAQELQSVKAIFSFERVFEEVGVGNVCDRAAMCSAAKRGTDRQRPCYTA